MSFLLSLKASQVLKYKTFNLFSQIIYKHPDRYLYLFPVISCTGLRQGRGRHQNQTDYYCVFIVKLVGWGVVFDQSLLLNFSGGLDLAMLLGRDAWVTIGD